MQDAQLVPGDRTGSLPSLLLLPVTAVVPFVILALGLLVALPPALVALPVTATAFLAVVMLRRKPEHRRWRYEAIATGIWGLGIDAISQLGSPALTLAWFVLPILLTAMLIPLRNRLFRSNIERSVSLRLARRIYAITYAVFSTSGSLVILFLYFWSILNEYSSGIFIALGILLLFAYLRYLSGDYFAREPILYLRAFSQEKIFATFFSVIVPAVSRIHVIVGLARTKERKTLLKGRLGFSTASLFLTADESWQVWVQRELQRAFAVIFDYSVETGNLSWEMEETIRICEPSRLVILVSKESTFVAPDSVRTVILGTTRAEKNMNRRELNDWLRSLPALTVRNRLPGAGASEASAS